LRKTTIVAAAAAITLLLSTGAALADETVTGEVVEKGCFLERGAHGADHAACAKRCLDRGSDMALLTADGDLFILHASTDDSAAFETLKDLVAKQATVSGPVVEEDGFKVMTVTASEAAG